MEPILHNRRSTVVIEKPEGPLKKYDVALYRRPTGEYVLHRVLRVLDSSYQIRGDHHVGGEIVPAEWILGVMKGYYETEGAQYTSCDSRKYRRYLKSLKVRHAWLWFRSRLRRIRRKLFPDP